MNNDRSIQKNEEKRDILRAPLIEGHRDIIFRDIEDRSIAEDVINIIEFTIKSSDDENKFGIIVEALNPLIQEKAKLIVSKLYMYKRRPCKFNNLCKDEKCIFIHDKDKKNKFTDSKRKIDENNNKRSKTIDNQNLKSTEVIINRVDNHKYSEDDIKTYASMFGAVESMKKLNDSKFLVIFEDPESAKRLVYSKEYVLGDSNIKKYYNIIENMKKYELNNLIDKHEQLLNQITTSSDVVEELKKTFYKIKNLIKENEPSHGSGQQENKKSINTSNSLYYNSF